MAFFFTDSQASTLTLDSQEEPLIETSSSVNVADWLAARYLLRSLDDDVIIRCYDAIIETFNDKIDIIQTLVKASTSNQITRIVDVLKTAQLKEIERNNHKIIKKYHKPQLNRPFFDYLSKDSIFNICEFLGKDDIKSFKLTSTSNALICFDIMRSYAIGVFNMMELLQHDDYAHSIDLHTQSRLKTNRIKAFTKYQCALQIYSKRYNIPLPHMLLFESTGYRMYEGLEQAKLLCDVNQVIHHKLQALTAFYILDKTQITKVNNGNKLSIMPLNPNAKELETYHIVLLQYFDSDAQCLENVQFLWLDYSTTPSRLETFLINDLLTHSSSCNQLINTVNQMKQCAANLQLDQPLLNIYSRDLFDGNYTEYTASTNVEPVSNINTLTFGVPGQSTVPYRRRFHGFTFAGIPDQRQSPKHKVITFELNPKHCYFGSRNDSDKMLLQPRYHNVEEYTYDQRHAYPLTLSNDTLPFKYTIYFKPCVNEETGACTSDIALQVTPSTTIRMLQNMVSVYFEHTISPNNIAFFLEIMTDHDGVQRKYFSCNETLREVSRSIINALGNNGLQIQWETTSFDTLSTDVSSIFKIYLYQPSMLFDGHFTFPKPSELNMYLRLNGDAAQPISVKVLMDTVIGMISDEMYGDNHKHLWVKKCIEMGDKYSLVVMNKEDITYKQYECYGTGDTYMTWQNEFDVCEVHVCVIHNDERLVVDKTDLLEAFPIIVRLCKSASFVFGTSNDVDLTRHSADIGYPKKIWITKETTLDHVMKKCFQINPERFEFDECLSKYGKLKYSDNIYQTIYANQSGDSKRHNELLILLKTIETQCNRFHFSSENMLHFN